MHAMQAPVPTSPGWQSTPIVTCPQPACACTPLLPGNATEHIVTHSAHQSPRRERTAAACMHAAATGLRPMACQAAACCHYGREMSGGRPGLQIEWSQNIKAVAPESVTAFESIMDGILTRGVTDLLRKTVPVKLPADVALRQCRVCSFRYQD